MISMREVVQPVFRFVSSIRKTNDHLLTTHLGLTLSQFKILSALKRAPRTSQRTLADFWMMTEASISRQVEILAKKKMITAAHNPETRREHLLKLTAEGEKALLKADRLIDVALERTFQSIGAKERKEFSVLTNRFLSLMPEYDRISH